MALAAVCASWGPAGWQVLGSSPHLSIWASSLQSVPWQNQDLLDLCNNIFFLLPLLVTAFIFSSCVKVMIWTKTEHIPKATMNGQSWVIALAPCTFDECQDLGLMYCFLKDWKLCLAYYGPNFLWHLGHLEDLRTEMHTKFCTWKLNRMWNLISASERLIVC